MTAIQQVTYRNKSTFHNAESAMGKTRLRGVTSDFCRSLNSRLLSEGCTTLRSNFIEKKNHVPRCVFPVAYCSTLVRYSESENLDSKSQI